MKSLVTGGAGFIGSHLVRELMGAGHEVSVVDDLSGGFARNLPNNIAFHPMSITSSEVDKLFAANRFDYVFHLAAYAAEGLSHFIRRFNYENNLIGSVNLINAAVRHGVKRFVFTSSIAVYGTGELPLRESQVPQPEDPYGIAKLAVEQDLQAAHEMFGLDYTILRPHNVFGEYQHIGDRYRNVVGIFMNQILNESPLTIFGDGRQKRAFSYVGDIIPMIANCVRIPETRGEVFNVGGETPYTVNELAIEVLAATNSWMGIAYLPPRREVLHAYADHTKAREAFGPRELTPLSDGLKRMWKWAQALGPQKKTRFKDIEVDKNLPEVWK